MVNSDIFIVDELNKYLSYNFKNGSKLCRFLANSVVILVHVSSVVQCAIFYIQEHTGKRIIQIKWTRSEDRSSNTLTSTCRLNCSLKNVELGGCHSCCVFMTV